MARFYRFSTLNRKPEIHVTMARAQGLGFRVASCASPDGMYQKTGFMVATGIMSNRTEPLVISVLYADCIGL